MSEQIKKEEELKSFLTLLMGPRASSFYPRTDRERLVGEMNLNYRMWKKERLRNSVPMEHLHTWKGIVGKTPNFSWTVEGVPKNPTNKWSFSQEYSPTIGCSARIQYLDSRPEDVGVEVCYKKYVGLFPKPKLFVALRGIEGRHTDALATKVFIHREIKNFEDYFIGAVYPKTLWVHPAYNSNNSVTLDFYLEQEWSARSVQSFGGRLFWKIENFRKYIWENKEIEFLSPYFYTTPRGYRVQALLSQVNMHLNLKLVFLNGIFDKSWQRELNYNVKVTVISPDFMTCIGQYTRYNMKGLALGLRLRRIDDIAMHNTICFKIEINMN